MSGKSKFVFALVVPMLFAWTPGVTAQETSETTEANVEEENQQICRRVRITGSNIPRRLCLSEEGWERLSSGGREEMRQNQADRFARTSRDDGSDGTLREDQNGLY